MNIKSSFTFVMLIIALFVSVTAHAQGNESGKTFYSAKKDLYNKVHWDHRQTFYANCTYISKKSVLWNTCGFKPRKNAKRAARIEAEHIMPAWEFGHQLQCWQKGGRKECGKNPKFVAMEADLHNLQPAIGEINGDRSNFKYGMIAGEDRVYGAVDFEVDFKARIAEPAPNVRGDIARTYFYMAETYGVRLSKKQQQLFTAWANQDPVDDWERVREERIAKIQGNSNRFISGHR